MLGGAGVAGAAGASLLPSFLAPSSLANAYRASSWRDRAGDLRRAGAGGGEPGGSTCPTGGLYADPGGGVCRACGNIFNKIMSQATRPPIISLVVERIDPGAAVYVCLVADRWPAAHAEELPCQIDMLTVLSLLYLAFIATLVGYGIWGSLLGRYCSGAGSGDGQRAAAAGETLERTAARRGGADHGRALYQRFRSASGAAWHGARVKKSPGDGAIHKYACNGITGRAAGSTARQVRQIYHCRPPYD